MNRRTPTLLALALAAAVLAPPPARATPSAPPAPAPAADGNVDLPRHPSLSPDGRTVVFSWKGDLWTVPLAGGTAVRLTVHPANETVARFSPDGRRLAFQSDRDGSDNIYVMEADGTGVRQVTWGDGGLYLSDYARDRDGREVVLFHAYDSRDVYREPRPWLVPVDGGEPVPLHGAHGRHPVLDAGARRVAFTRGGSSWWRRHYRGPAARDVWLHDRDSGAFTRITSWSGNDGKVHWAGEDLLFLSDREDDTVNLYRLTAGAAEATARRLTNFRGADVWDFDVSADGRTAVVSSWGVLHRVDLAAGGAPTPITITAAEDEADDIQILDVSRRVTEAALSPDGKVMAVVAYGEVWLRNIDDKEPTRRVTHHPALEKDLAWSADGTELWFTSDRDGTESIWRATVTLTRGEVKAALEPKPAPAEPGDDAAGEDADDDADDDATEDAAGKDGAEEPDADGEPQADAEGEAPADDDTKDDAAEKPPTAADRAKRWHDALEFRVEPLVQTPHHDREADPSPDGTRVAFRRGLGDLVVRDLATGTETTVLESWDSYMHWTWSPDGRWLAWAVNDLDFNMDIWMRRSDASAPAVNLTRHPDSDWQPRFSADGRVLVFLSERKDEEVDVWRVLLDRDLEALTAAELVEYYADAAKAAKGRKPAGSAKKDGEAKDGEAKDDKAAKKPAKPAPEPFEPDLDDAWRHVARLTSHEGNEGNLAITPGGDRIVYTSGGGLMSIKWDGSDAKRIAGSGTVQHVTLKGDQVVVVSGNQAVTVPPGGGSAKTHAIAARMRIDLREQSSRKFVEAARLLGERFYHPSMKGLDWEAVTARYHALARHARTADEFNEVANRFLGELNGSHLGIRKPGWSSSVSEPVGHLGVDSVAVEGGYRVDRVLADGPAGRGTLALRPGDVLFEADGRALGGAMVLDRALRGTVGREIVVRVRRTTAEDGDAPRELALLVTPVSSGAERNLRYVDWRRRTLARVEELSDGRLGYIHIRGMDQPSLDVFERDLYAAAYDKQGLLVDVRNNGGGWTTDRLLASLMAPVHAYTIPRGADRSRTGHYPQDRLFIQRTDLPLNMLCNEKSFSNAEIVSHAFKTLGRGTLVGEQTYGGVISTGGTQLVDGTFVRIPFRGWYLPDGTDMENHGAMPDLRVEQTPEAESAGRDDQLEAAVRDLLQRLDR